MAGPASRRQQFSYAKLAKVVLPFTLLAVYVVWMQSRSDRVAKAAQEVQAFSDNIRAQPYLSFQQKPNEGGTAAGLPSDRHRKLIMSGQPAQTFQQSAGNSAPSETGAVTQLAQAAPISPSPMNITAQQKDPKTNFSALAAAVKDVGARNAAAATVQSGYLDDPKAAPSTLGDVLRDPPDSGTPIDETDRRLRAVKTAMRDSWGAYVKYAWGQDELLPISGQGTQAFCNTGATLLDGLDTLWIMDMKQEFARGRDWVANNLAMDADCQTSLFELVIRGVGGLLAAYDLSKDPIFLTKAADMADRMMGAFDTPTGIPLGQINLNHSQSSATSWAGSGNSILSELGSVQLEFVHLSTRTGNATYGMAAERIIEYLHDRYPDEALLPTSINYSTGGPGGGQITMGALADSYYEYLLKVWILKGRNDEVYRGMWVRAMDEMLARLVGFAENDQLHYVGDINGGIFTPRMEHLTCFVAGNLALGVANGAVDGAKGEEYLGVAKNLTKTCFEMYNKMPTGLGPETVSVSLGKGVGFNIIWPEAVKTSSLMSASRGLGPETVDFSTGALQKGVGYNILRPEAVESICMLYRITNDTIYREWGWQMFQAFEQYSKAAKGGYSGVTDVGVMPPMQDNKMQSFWLAETLKYLYLLFSPSNTISLDEWVFNTEAHPFALQAKSALVYSTPGAASASSTD